MVWTKWDREYVDMRFDRIERMLLSLGAVVIVETEAEMATIQDLVDTVAQQSTVIESVEALLDGLAEQLTAAGVDPAKLDELKAQIEANTQKLAAAVAKHTAADDENHAAGM